MWAILGIKGCTLAKYQRSRQNVAKIGGATMGVSPKQTLQNSNFLTTHAGHMKFSG